MCAMFVRSFLLQAFFQVNTKAAEVLYSTVGEVAELDENTTLLDVCCGTGTIGLCLAHKVKQVSLV
jgi:tRNA (uracil-5-)-methyltransferase